MPSSSSSVARASGLSAGTADATHGGGPVHRWHALVHEDEVEGLLTRKPDRLSAAGGLSIARAIAQRGGAKLDVSEDGDGRIVFSAAFPAKARP